VDVAIAIVCAGCFVLGLFWGAVRMVTVALAAVAAAIAARLAGPSAAALLGGSSAPSSATRIAATILVAIVASGLVVLAGRGLRKGIEALRLSWLDRLAGGVVATALAGFALALLLGLAVEGGLTVTTPWAQGLAVFGQTFLALQSHPTRSATPSNSPPTPTMSGHQAR
jgi:uncharacterized membrane protein required for colicin V production